MRRRDGASDDWRRLAGWRWLMGWACVIVGGSLTLAGCQADETISEAERERLMTLGPLDAMPPSPSNAVADDPAAVELGAWLFADDNLSLEGSRTSCMSCHQPALGWGDDRQFSTNANGNQSARHAQVLTNVGYQQFMFWSGRADSLWAQAFKVLLGAPHSIDKVHVVSYLRATPDYAPLYEPVFGPIPDIQAMIDDPEVSPAEIDETLDEVLINCAKAMEAFQRRIVSTNSALDRWIEGDEDALTEQQKRGAALFVGKAGCIDCHSGPNLSDGWFHNIGLAPGADGVTAEAGLASTLADTELNAAGKWSDDPEWGAAQIAALQQRVSAAGSSLVGAHKTPTLRDVAFRPRLGHNGDVQSLTTWIRRYSSAQIDPGAVGSPDPAYVARNLSDAEIADLVAFMDALTGNPSSAQVDL
jgi:cytochrome c peroxidase